MKNRFKYFGIIATVAVIGLSMAACIMGDDDNGKSGGKTVEAVTFYTTFDFRSNYLLGDTFEDTGVIVQVRYTDGPMDQITTGFTVSGDTSSVGVKTITVIHTASQITATWAATQGHGYYIVYPAVCTQEDFYGTWISAGVLNEIITINENSIVIEEFRSHHNPNGNYTITSWGSAITRNTAFPPEFIVDITTDTTTSSGPYNLVQLYMRREIERDVIYVYYENPNVPTEPYLSIGVLFAKPSNW